MGYVKDNLLTAERIVYEARLHWTIFFGLRGLLTLGIWPAIVRASSEFVVTNRRVLIKVGLIQRRTLELNLSKVESIEIEQTVWGRLLGYGEIEVIGTGGTREKFERVGNPLGFRRAVAEATEAASEIRLAAPEGQAMAAGPSGGAASPEERLARAEAMRDKGLITPEEYEQVRKRIVAEM